MTEIVGNVLIFGTVLYVFFTLRYADKTYEQILRVDPGYFSDADKPLTKMLDWSGSVGVIKFITDRSLSERNYPDDLAKRIDNAKALYFCVPIAFVAFFVGILIR